MAAWSSNNQDPVVGPLDFERLAELHYGPLYRFAMSLTRAENDACDLVQQTFLIWANKGHQLQDAAKARSWLFTTLYRAYLESRRRGTRFPHLELEEATDELPHVHPDVVNRLDAQEVLKLLGKLDEQFRAAVALFYLEDYSYDEIATILGVPLGTVKSRISRGVLQLKRMILDPSSVASQSEKKS